MKEENVKEWLRLSESGHVAEAEDFYYNTLFRDVIDEFCERNSQPQIRCNVLFSILGYSPEPIILTQRALNPEVHIIFTTDIQDPEASKKIRSYLSMYLTSEFKIVEVHDVSFNGIYACLKDQMLLHPSQDYVIDITGGKKSMVATAAIFGRDFNCNVVYVDYDQYVSQIRKPLPGSERLNYVYTPSIDLPEIKFFSEHLMSSNIVKGTINKDVLKKTNNNSNSFTSAFIKILSTIESENSYSRIVNVEYVERKKSVLFYNLSPSKKFEIYIPQQGFYNAYKDYTKYGMIKDMSSYLPSKLPKTNLKRELTFTFSNIIEALDEELRK